MKKLVSLALVLVLAIGCVSLVACNGDEEEPASSSEATATPKPEAAAPSEEEEAAPPDEEEAAPPEEEEADPPPEEEEAAPPEEEAVSGTFTWDDMPVYPGAEEDEDAVTVDMASAEGVRMEWRHYKTTDSFDQVVAFYKSEMPQNDWAQARWADLEPTTPDWLMEGGIYAKNDHHDQASVEIADKADGSVYIALMRVSDQEDSAPASASSGEPASAGEGLTWDDVPTYPGVDTDESAWTTTSAADGFQSETRTYVTSDSADQVAVFYKSEMVANGWDQAMWTGSGDVETGIFTKNSDQNVAQIMIMEEGDQGTRIQVTRIYEESE